MMETATMKTEIEVENIYDSLLDRQELPRDLFNHHNTEPPLLSDDIWNKFELDFPDLTGNMDDIFTELDGGFNDDSLLFDILNDAQIRNHDCMWAGHCGSKEHPADEPRPVIVPIAPKPAPPPRHVKPQVHNQQSLLKPRPMVMPYVVTPQTPPMSDDEEGKSKKTEVAKILEDTITATHLSEITEEDIKDLKFDADGYEDELEEEEDDEDEEEEEEEEEKKEPPKYSVASYASVNDHSYHKEKNSYVLDTPSDSEEEEIDVVSVEKSYCRIPSSLPTNPSTRDRHQIQRRMATAITRKRMPTTSKTITTPMKKTMVHHHQHQHQQESTAKRRMVEARSAKRAKHYRIQNSTPYKRRHVYGNSSDSEPEPSEKRSLHNNMERQRRIDLRNAFEDLRLLVPEVSKKDRAAKVVILREASQYCDYLGTVSQGYARQCDDLRRRQEWLRQRVSQLRRSLAAKR